MLAAGQTAPVGDSSYVAAVYEHNLILNPDPRVTATRAAALEHMQKNLDIYEVQAARAAEQVRSEQRRYLLLFFLFKETVAHYWIHKTTVLFI